MEEKIKEILETPIWSASKKVIEDLVQLFEQEKQAYAKEMSEKAFEAGSDYVYFLNERMESNIEEKPNKEFWIEQNFQTGKYRKWSLCPKCNIVPAKGGGCINHSDCPMRPLR